MRQVDEAELIVTIAYRLSRMSVSRRNELASRQGEVRRQAERMVATELVRTALKRYEILSAAPLPVGQRVDLWSRAAYGWDGTGAPMIEDEPTSNDPYLSSGC